MADAEWPTSAKATIALGNNWSVTAGCSTTTASFGKFLFIVMGRDHQPQRPPMRQRGRKSAESVLLQRPDPPAELSIEQAEVWRAYVDQMPADWFRPEMWPMVCQLCRHQSNSRLLAMVEGV
jgi:hypothetical protein